MLRRLLSTPAQNLAFRFASSISAKSTCHTKEAVGTVRDIHNRMPVILDKDSLQDWIHPDGDPSAIVEKALSNMVFETAVEYHRSPTEFITA
nr:SOS response-associated peptidase family protein [Ruminococcus flavefaciens]